MEVQLIGGYSTIIDDQDAKLVLPYRWSDNGGGYLQSWINGRRVLLHRFILSAVKGQEVDHINRVKTDNRRENLRFVTRSENMLNTGRMINKLAGTGNTYSRYLGVTWSKKSNKWQAQMRRNNRNYYLGLFESELDASNAYQRASDKFKQGT